MSCFFKSIPSIARKARHIAYKKKQCALPFVYVVYAIYSFILGLCEKKKWTILLPDTLFSAIGGFAVNFPYIRDRITAAETRPLSDRKLGAVQIAFSVVQFLNTLIILIVRVAHIKIDFEFSSLYSISVAIIDCTYIFKNILSSSEAFPRDNEVDIEAEKAPLLRGSAPSGRFQYKGCKISRKHVIKLAVEGFFFLLEIVSFALDLSGKKGWCVNLTAAVLSAFDFIVVACIFIRDRCAGQTKPQSERLFGVAEFAFSLLQFCASMVPLIARKLNIKVDYTFSGLCPLIFSIIILAYAWKDDATSKIDIPLSMPTPPSPPPLSGVDVLNSGASSGPTRNREDHSSGLRRRNVPTEGNVANHQMQAAPSVDRLRKDKDGNVTDDMQAVQSLDRLLKDMKNKKDKDYNEKAVQYLDQLLKDMKDKDGNVDNMQATQTLDRLVKDMKDGDGIFADCKQAKPFLDQLMFALIDKLKTVTAATKAELFFDPRQKPIEDLVATVIFAAEDKFFFGLLRKNIKDLVATIIATTKAELFLDQLRKNIKDLVTIVTTTTKAELVLDQLQKNIKDLEENVTDNMQVVQSLDRLWKTMIDLFTIRNVHDDMQAIVPVQPLVDRDGEWRRAVVLHILEEVGQQADKLGPTLPKAKEKRLSRSKGWARAPKTRLNEPKLASAGRPWKTPKIGPKHMKSR